MPQRHRNKSHKPYSNDKVTKDEKSSTDSTMETAAVPTKETQNNDPAWYARDPYLLRDAASYSFGYAYGKEYKIGKSTNPNISLAQWVEPALDIPGICALRVKPSFGLSDAATSPLNTEANALYAYVRHMNSGRKNYDPCDLMLYLTAIAHLYSYIIFCERAYAIAQAYSEQNRYLPDGLLRAMTINPISFREELADFRMWLNTFINRVSCFVVPNDITYFNKTVFMYRDIFLENGDGNIKDQLYMYVPDGFYVFNLDKDNRGFLDYYPWFAVNGGLKQVSDLIYFGESMLLGLFGDEDASLMSGDIFKVYQDRVIRLPSLDEAVGIPLVYDPMVLWQMKNTNILKVIRKRNSETATSTSDDIRNINESKWKFNTNDQQECYPGCVWQDNSGLLISVERVVNEGTTSYSISNTNKAALYMDKVLSSDLAHPTPDVVMESSRNILIGAEIPQIDGILNSTSTNKHYGWVECGSYITVGVEIIYMSAKNFVVDYWQGGKVGTLKNLSRAMKFRYIPWLFNDAFDSNGNLTDYYLYNDINNFIVLNSNNIKKLHDVALLSLLYVPGVAKIS